jgi:hypothetical protein
VEDCSIAQGVWPKREVHCLRPASASVQQLLACALQEVVDGLLGDAILKVCVYATEGKLLALFVAGLFECVIGKLPIIAMLMLNFYAVLGGENSKAHLAAIVLMDELSI